MCEWYLREMGEGYSYGCVSIRKLKNWQVFCDQFYIYKCEGRVNYNLVISCMIWFGKVNFVIMVYFMVDKVFVQMLVLVEVRLIGF